ncbi:Os02g0727600 [Oryza sativa Japonica Group]|uniref:Os02g0727600 protein n=4 Tax=Oryza TaxID=4527 RepID=Q6Z331_ORYSJ|nr:hypothetical protein OsI_08764 [Oryza sativa Indica Group]BAD16093.1 hypothetical protein [Oryza sativa Japonica Group]BAS80711.1 Os02g0727600 [Oryza sativa Japonica Group]
MEPDRVMFLVAIIGALLLSSSGGKWINFAAMATTAEGGGDVPPPGGEACRRVYDPPDENCDPDSCKAICSLRYNGVGVCDPVGCQCTYCHPPSPPPKFRTSGQ